MLSWVISGPAWLTSLVPEAAPEYILLVSYLFLVLLFLVFHSSCFFLFGMKHINSIMSWNICNITGLLGNKSDDPDFINIVKDHSVVCLQETGSDVNISGYHSFSDLRSTGNRGGVTTLIKKKLDITSKVVKINIPAKRSMNIMVVRISNSYGQHVFIINVYIPPHNSIRKDITTTSETNFDILHEVVNKLADTGDIIICGDLNARIGVSEDINPQENAADFIDLPSSVKYNSHRGLPPNIPISAKRTSQDMFTNSHKAHLLDLVRANNLLILNGRTLGDSSGKYTCFNWNGNSVVDYFICNREGTSCIKSLSVKQHTIYSDHNPVVLSLWSPTIPYCDTTKPSVKVKHDNAPFRFKVNEHTLQSFKDALGEHSNVTKINDLLMDTETCANASDIRDLCDGFTDLVNEVASNCFVKTKNITGDVKSKQNPWFDKHCRTAKRELNKSCRILSKHPNNSNIKLRHRQNKKSYRKLVKNKKDRFFENLNKKIKAGKVLSWKDFKKIKKFTKSDTKLDDDQIDDFQLFYQNLYSDEHGSIDDLTKRALFQDADSMANSFNTPNKTLNEPFNMEELKAAISQLSSGKASSFDHISNEIIKSFDNNFRLLVLKLFNLCLNHGVYFWNKSVITPLHKKGSISNPDNYRAIAVCSCLGKLLSSMLLARLITYRSTNSPDPPNQRGFTKGSQCNDHIFTLHTILEKYKRKKKKIYAVFIDLRKAFDLVCRQALLYKLACYGVNGGFFNIIKSMYNDSTGYIKMNGKLSKFFNIMKGTEQGHPLSPELFKVYFKDLSDQLNSAATNCPTLSGLDITHLAWADDLIALALDHNSLQKQLDIIENYCNRWGLEINVDKTKFMVLNSTNRQNYSQNDPSPTLNGQQIERVTSYCYLGIVISCNGNFKNAVDSLYIKDLSASFSLRKTIDRRFIDVKCHDQLFNMLVRPILTYGCQIWLPLSPIFKTLINCNTSNINHDQILKSFARQPYERAQLRHIKYMLGIGRRSSNLSAWGETGKLPLAISSISLCIDYFRRIINLPDSNFTKAAITEQIQLNLPWFENIKKVIDRFGALNPKDYKVSSNPITNAIFLSDLCSPATVTESIKDLFFQIWSAGLVSSSKLDFYRSIKVSFDWEHYLDNSHNFKERRSTSRIRCSSHKLHIETGRYTNTTRSDRLCNFCHTMHGLSNIESEDHILNHCPNGSTIRQNYLVSLHDIFKSSQMNLDHAPTFNMASTYPNDLSAAKTKDDADTRSRIIKLTCKTIHRLYDHTINYNDELELNK